MTKVKIIYIFLIFLLIGNILCVKKSYATENRYIKYDFFVTKDSAYLENKYNVLLANSISASTLENGKIAPGTKGNFKVNIKISRMVISKYRLSFGNFSGNLPKNLKFYFNGEEIDLKTFSLTDIQSSNMVSYLFSWEWQYETKDNISNSLVGDVEDTNSSEIGNLSFDIILHAEYEEIIVDNGEKLPRSGDISTNF